MIEVIQTAIVAAWFLILGGAAVISIGAVVYTAIRAIVNALRDAESRDGLAVLAVLVIAAIGAFLIGWPRPW